MSTGQAPALPIPTLETDRFTLRPLVREDAPAFFPTLSSPEHCRYLTRAPFASLEELESWLCDPEWNGRSWSAVERATGEIAARVVAVPGEEGSVEIGYITAAHRHGEGIASECAKRLIAYLFGEERHHRITAGTDPRNAASNALLARLGFRREAHMVESIKTHIGWCDEYFWAMLRREWQG
ncbi:GNAT family N-acetyltransferase [Pontixanthobacter aquaemixtae]|uniref:GNAT family N-acetyltransferase n=1 Tax=Pontixanthobacter aquaemixtae TaxID=1958940 RepID=A0A844ZT53_9SPHN|nr:GNAT family N-acetyltransferase [Pontixanthobacter aquaemixtae]MXO90654.1 GNAT family N-acetyltransferase [Pontixanthobacter aquaemixtae]